MLINSLVHVTVLLGDLNNFAGCLYAEYGGGFRHPLCSKTHDLSLDLQYGEAKRHAYNHLLHIDL